MARNLLRNSSTTWWLVHAEVEYLGDGCGGGLPPSRFVRMIPVKQSIRPGDRIFVQCEGGPCVSRLERFPPQLEVEERGGMYVLIDEGEPEDWRYLFVPDTY